MDGKSVDFSHLLRGGERVAVYPMFERYDVSPVTRLRPAPLRETRFVADVHLGTLARNLRLLGFDTVWERDPADEAIGRTEAARSVPLQVFLVYREFKRCASCGRTYWRGSHLKRLDRIVERARASGR